LNGPGSSERIVQEGVSAALEKKAAALLVLNLGEISSFADYFVICTATSERQSQAIAESLEERMKLLHRSPVSVEGKSSGRWILLDYGDVVFHVFLDEARRFYALERLWGDAGDETVRFAASH
jgi:ribosome-associated protein